MVEHIASAVVGAVVGAAASALTNKYEELTGVPDKIHQLDWKLLKIQSAIRESNKYDIENEELRMMVQALTDVVQKGSQVLQEFNNTSSSAADHPNQAVAIQNPIIEPDMDQAITAAQRNLIIGETRRSDDEPRSSDNETYSSLWLSLSSLLRLKNTTTRRSIRLSYWWFVDMVLGSDFYIATTMTDQIRHNLRDFISKIREIQKLNRILERVEGISGDVNDFLEMLRHQKRKREKRRRYRPYKGFFMLAYLELAQDALGYWWARISWMQFLVPEIAAFVETKSEFGLKAGGTKLSGVSKHCLVLSCWIS